MVSPHHSEALLSATSASCEEWFPKPGRQKTKQTVQGIWAAIDNATSPLTHFINIYWVTIMYQVLQVQREGSNGAHPWEDHLENRKATHSSSLAWGIPWTVWSMGSQRFGYDWATFPSLIDDRGVQRGHVSPEGTSKANTLVQALCSQEHSQTTHLFCLFLKIFFYIEF